MLSRSAEMMRRGSVVASMPISSNRVGKKDVFIGGWQSVAQDSMADLRKEMFSGQSDSGRGGRLASPNHSAAASL